MTQGSSVLFMSSAREYIDDMPASELLTAQELERLHIPDKRSELVRGQLVVREPAGGRHGVVAGEMFYRIRQFIEGRNLGVAFAAETGFTLARNPDTVRAPDAGFITTARVPTPMPRGFPALAPDLAVEVLSPGDRPGEVLAKVADWLQAGTRLVWVIDPERRVARVYRADGSESLLDESGAIGGEDLLPGLSISLSDLLNPA